MPIVVGHMFKLRAEADGMTVWERLGLEGQKVLILHHDDLGFTLSTNLAYAHLCTVVGPLSGSIMMTGGWAPHIRQGDLGVHLTLTSEMEYPRMRPLTEGRSLMDSEGYMWKTLEEAWTHIDTNDVEAELQAQIGAFYARGTEPTHIDTHMGSVLRPDLAEVYHRLAVEYRLPCLLPETLDDIPLPPPMRIPFAAIIDHSPLPKMRLIDSYVAPVDHRTEWYLDTLNELPPGIYHLRHHAALPGPETEQLPDAGKRIGDYAALTHPEVQRVLGTFQRPSFAEIRDAWRSVVPP